MNPARTLAYVGCSLLLCACAVNPVTGERELALISEQQEVQIGRQAAQEARTAIGLVQDDGLQAYVHKLGTRLASTSQRPELPWSFQVVDDPTPNAFALPGGFIFVTRGMLNHMDSEAELASVLGHEIGHVTARHSVQQMSRAQLAQLGLGLGMVFFPEMQSLGGLLSSGLQLLFLKYGRDAERQADELGFGYALNSGFDVRQMGDVFATLQRISQAQNQSPLPAWASTHPDPGERIQAVQARLQAAEPLPPDLQLGRDEFLKRIDGLVWGANPRQGFFDGTRFIHPELAFEITFPSGWRTQNLTQAVLAGSPQQDAITQLTLAPGKPDQAIRQFASQEGVQVGQPTPGRIGGLDTLLTRFAAQTQQGVLQGVVAFVEYGGRTYQIVGYTPAARYANWEQTFLRTIESFGSLKDPKLLAVQPQKMKIVRIPRDMSLAEFAKTHRSTVDLQTLALINQVSDQNAMLKGGTLVKHVVGDPPPTTARTSSAQ